MSSDEIKIWAMDGSGGATPLPLSQQTESEQLLEDTLVSHPEMLMEGLSLVGRQTRTDDGWLDLLGVDEDGRLVVFELKRGSLSRDAVAQVIDYASFLDAKSETDLMNYVSAKARLPGADRIEGFESWYGDNFGGNESASLKPVRMVLVGLGADESTTRMARFLANQGVEISLLTFNGYSYNGSTLLAKQVQVEAVAEPLARRQRGPRPGRAERRELLNRRIDQHTELYPEARELWDAVLQMFREDFPRANEVANRGASDWAKHRLDLRLAGSRAAVAAIQLGPIANHPELVMPMFYSDTVNTCLTEFIQIRQELSDYWTYPPNRRNVEDRDVQVGFPIKSLAEWDERKDRLWPNSPTPCMKSTCCPGKADGLREPAHPAL